MYSNSCYLRLNMSTNIYKLGVCAFAVALSGAVSANTQEVPGVPVSVMSTELESLAASKDLVARFEALAHTHITPRVTGYLVEQLTPNGALVKKGDVLFKLDDTVYRHNLALALAQTETAKAAQRTARLHHSRIVKLQDTGGSTRSDLDLAKARLDSANAAVTGAQVGYEKAAYDLNSTVIRAPYDGQMGKARFSIGDQISPATGALVDIVQLSPINLAFSVDYNTYMEYQLNNAGVSRVRLAATGADADIHYVANKVDASAGTVEVAATFDNSDYRFKPNKVTQVSIEHQSVIDGVWIPQSALMRDLTVQYVYVIDENNMAQRQNVTIASQDSGKAFVTEGLEGGLQVITDGLIRVRPNTPVAPVSGQDGEKS